LTDPGENLAQMKTACNNRILFAAGEYRPHKGVTTQVDEVKAKVRNGYVGLKFWFGDPHRVLAEGERGITEIDDIRLEDYFSALERGNILMASLHIADPNGPFNDRQNWMKDPVYFWNQIRAFENVVAKYPKLTIVAAHGAWLVCQDAQIDYLRYMLSRYPNFYIDLSATFQYMPLVNPENLRDFCIEFQDRILYGTDGGRVADNAVNTTADKYANTFAILETDQMVKGSYFGDTPVKGLNLPKEVLEKIYYKNALNLYPGLREAMGLGRRR
jgi:predicted TIM-barrel fold metal-dependent hydrolase